MSTLSEPLMETARAAFVKWLEADLVDAAWPDLGTIEAKVQEFVHELGRVLIQAYLDRCTAQARDPGGRPSCRACEKPMELLKKTVWSRHTLFGEVKVTDHYARCRTYGESARPLHPLIGTRIERWSPAAQRVVVDLAADESCEKAVGKLGRLCPEARIDRSTARHFVIEHGQRACRFIAGRLGQGGREESESLTEREVELDGSMVPVATSSAGTSLRSSSRR